MCPVLECSVTGFPVVRFCTVAKNDFFFWHFKTVFPHAWHCTRPSCHFLPHQKHNLDLFCISAWTLFCCTHLMLVSRIFTNSMAWAIFKTSSSNISTDNNISCIFSPFNQHTHFVMLFLKMSQIRMFKANIEIGNGLLLFGIKKPVTFWQCFWLENLWKQMFYFLKRLLSRSKLDAGIELCVRSCSICKNSANMPQARALHS